MRCPPASGHRPDAFPRCPLTRATLPAASPQELRATHTTRAPPPCPACRRRSRASQSPSGMERGMLARPRLRRSWRSRGPGDPTRDPAVLAIPLRHTGLTALPWLGPPAGPLPRPAPSALAAPPRQCPARFRVLRLVCVPLSVPSILLSALRLSASPERVAFRQRAACPQCLPNRLAGVRRGLTPAGPSSLPNRPDFRRFVSSLCPHRARPAPARPCRTTRAGLPSSKAGRFVQLRKELRLRDSVINRPQPRCPQRENARPPQRPGDLKSSPRLRAVQVHGL